MSRLDRVRACGWSTVSPAGYGNGGPGLRLTADPSGGGIAGFSGLATCGSVWACPVCSAKIATRRADELAAVMKFALAKGCDASLVTLTMRHHEGQSLKACWDALSKAWAAVTSGKQWVGDTELFALRGWVKAVEVTRGKNGWHVHLHALMIWDNPAVTDRHLCMSRDGHLTIEQARYVGRRMWQRWDRALRRRGFDSLRDLGGLDVRLASLIQGEVGGLHEYFVKLSHEIAGGQGKLAKGGGRTPFQILADGLARGLWATGEADATDDADAWWEWEKASLGRRQIAWSKGLREWAGLDDEQSDDEVAAEQLEGDDLLFIDPDSWRHLRTDPDAVCDLLECTEDGGYAAAMPWLSTRGFGYVVLKMIRQVRDKIPSRR